MRPVPARSRIPRSRLRRSATIIEISICIMILGVALPALITSFADAARQSMRPISSTIAAFLAVERMEEIVARRYRDNTGYDGVVSGNFPNETPVSGFTGFNRTVTISNVTSSLAASGPDVGYKKVRVTVTWEGGAESLVIERVFAKFTP